MKRRESEATAGAQRRSAHSEASTPTAHARSPSFDRARLLATRAERERSLDGKMSAEAAICVGDP